MQPGEVYNLGGDEQYEVSVEILDASKKGLFNALLELARFRKEAVEHLLSKIG
jgi:hypothetical protein